MDVSKNYSNLRPPLFARQVAVAPQFNAGLRPGDISSTAGLAGEHLERDKS
jgi:hypothetical protein